MKRVGILGGSWNPPHRGHLLMADEMHRLLDLDEVWMWVSYNIFKDPAVYAPLEERTALATILKGDNRPWLKVQDMEKDFHDPMTASSLTMLRAMYPENNFIWMFGDDNFASFENWNHQRFEVDGAIVPDWQYIMHNFSVAVMNRPPYREAARAGVAAQHGAALFLEEPKHLSAGRVGWSFVDNALSPESSSGIKLDWAAGKRNLPGLTPALEARMEAKGLFLPRGAMNAAANVPAANNPVRIDAFLTLASAANLVKALGQGLPGYKADRMIHCAAASWDKSAQKGDFNKPGEVPGELADCLIVLYSIAARTGERLSLRTPGTETQDSVFQWCSRHYPGADMLQRLEGYMEEMTELCAAEGLEKHRLVNLLTLVLNDNGHVAPGAAPTGNLVVLEDYARHLGLNLQAILDDKMKINRQRTTAQSAARLAAKQQIIKREPG